MQFEVDFIVALQSVASGGLTMFFKMVSLLGSYLGFIILLIIIFAYNKKMALNFGVCFLGGVGINYILKTLIARPRPFMSHPEIMNLTDTLGQSMPSSHALCSVIIAIFLCYFIFKLTKNKWARGAAIAGGVVIICLTWISRMYLGMHYLTDLLVGGIIGVVIATIGIVIMEKSGAKNKNKV